MKQNILYICMALLLVSACKSKQKITPTDGALEACNIAAVVEDYSSLDGCGKILITHEGYKILPAKPEVLTDYMAKAEVLISYVEIADLSSICMAEDFIAEILCIESNQKPMAKECINAGGKNDITWIKSSTDFVVSKIDKYSFLGDGWSYIVTDMGGLKRVYNCQGDLLCSYKDLPDSRCSVMIREMTFLKTIYATTSTK